MLRDQTGPISASLESADGIPHFALTACPSPQSWLGLSLSETSGPFTLTLSCTSGDSNINLYTGSATKRRTRKPLLNLDSSWDYGGSFKARRFPMTY
jgi:hypothetical protein